MKYIILIGFIFTLSNCKSQTKEPQKPKAVKHSLIKNHAYNQIINNKKMEHFDVKKFEANKDESENYIYKAEDGTKVKEFGDKDNGYFRNLTMKNSLYSVYQEFYSTGNIKTKGQIFRNDGCQLGIWTEYDEKGTLIKTTDTDKPFIISIEDIIKFLEEKRADLQASTTTVDRYYDEQTKVSVWTLNYVGEYEGKTGSYIIEIDGKAGDILKVRQILGKHGEHKILYDKELSGDKKTSIYIKPRNDKDEGGKNQGFWSSLLE